MNPVKTFHVAAQSVDDGFCPDIRIDITSADNLFGWHAVDADEDGANFEVEWGAEWVRIHDGYCPIEYQRSLFDREVRNGKIVPA